MNGTILSISQLMVYYENALAINNVTLQIPAGKVSGLFGMNGSGKTTFMTTVSGLIMHKKKQAEMRGGERIHWFGGVRFQDEDIPEMEPSLRARKGLVLCPERRRVFAESTALENLKIGGHLATRAQAKKTLGYVFELFPELHRLKDRFAGLLSGGEQQMLAIGRALMAQPKLLLLDEPLLGLAPSVEARLARAIREINRELGLTIVISEQYARPLLPVVDLCFVLEHGGLCFEGTQDEFFQNPDVVNAYFGAA